MLSLTKRQRRRGRGRNRDRGSLTVLPPAVAPIQSTVVLHLPPHGMAQMTEAIISARAGLVDFNQAARQLVESISPYFSGVAHDLAIGGFQRLTTESRHQSWGQSSPIACQGCRYLHNAIYGGERLVCGMHPYGPTDEKCADHSSQSDLK